MKKVVSNRSVPGDANAGISRLKEEQEKSINDCNQRIAQWKEFENDYTKLYAFLGNVADKLSYDVMVPFGKLAFMPGRLVNTNNVLALLGDNWFVERSTKDTQGIVGRRIQACQETLKKLDEERVQIGAWKEHTSTAMADGDFKEICEEYDETMKPSWSEKRKQKERIKHLSNNKVNSESSLPKVRWQDDQNEPAQITFRHSHQTVSLSSPSDDKASSEKTLLSPGDIVKVFVPTCVQPRPILKVSKTGANAPVQGKDLPTPSTTDAPVLEQRKTFQDFNQAFTGTIVEKTCSAETGNQQHKTNTESNPSRPISRFKSRKAKQ